MKSGSDDEQFPLGKTALVCVRVLTIYTNCKLLSRSRLGNLTNGIKRAEFGHLSCLLESELFMATENILFTWLEKKTDFTEKKKEKLFLLVSLFVLSTNSNEFEFLRLKSLHLID